MDDEVAKDMLEQREVEPRSGPRYLATLEVRAEWDDSDGAHIVTEGTTENVGPAGTLVHLPRRLPEVGGRVRLEVQDQEVKNCTSLLKCCALSAIRDTRWPRFSCWISRTNGADSSGSPPRLALVLRLPRIWMMTRMGTRRTNN